MPRHVRALRILSIAPDLGRGGMQRAVETFSLCYQRAGHCVAVLAWRAGGARAATLRGHRIEVFVGGPDLPNAVSAADAFDPDVIHIHRVGVANPTETAILKRLRRAPHRRVIETNVFGRVDRSEGADSIDVHMLLSDWCLWRWRRWLRPETDRIGVVIPNPVDTGRFVRASAERVRAFRAKLGIPLDGFVCGRVGQPDPVKWHRATFAAFEHLARLDPTAHLVLIGLPSTMRRFVSNSAVEVRRRIVEVACTDVDDELVDAYSAFDCFLHAAAIGESFGYVLAEAMLCQCPVVTASTPQADNSQLEVVRHLAGGIVAASPDALPAALVALRNDGDLRSRLTPHLRQHVTSRFDADAVSARALELAAVALDMPDRSALRDRITETPHMRSQVTATDIRRLLSNSFGRPRGIDLMVMHLRHFPAVQTCIDARLSRRLRRTDAVTLGSVPVAHEI